MKDKWNDEVFYRLIALVKQDQDYQELLARSCQLEADYCRIIKAMPEKDSMLLDEYIAACEEMQCRMTRLAYQLGQSE